jgi:putative peptidoglycan lipid II flippase
MLGRPAIALFLERGAFTPESTLLVYRVLVFFSVRIVSEATLEIAARLFFAQHDTRTPMFVALGWLVVNVALAFGLVEWLGIGGLALASTIAFTLQSAVLLILNHRRLGGLLGRELGMSAARTLTAAAGMAVVVWAVGLVVDGRLPLLILGTLTGGISYLGLNLLLGGQEIPDLLRLLRRG